MRYQIREHIYYNNYKDKKFKKEKVCVLPAVD